MVIVLWTMSAVSAVFLGLRLYTKVLRRRRLYWDDYFILAAWILLALSASSTTANVRRGFGQHIFEIPLENLVDITFGVLSNISGFASILAVACSKTSFAITLLRLSDGWMKWFIWSLLILLNTSHYLSALFFWVSCNPPAKTYNRTLPGTCWPDYVSRNYSFFVGACSAFSDFALALLPWRILLRYNMYNREKIGVAIAMSMGVFAGVICIIKMTTIPLLYGDDFTYESFPLVVWGFVEPAVTIMAASIPMLRHLFKSLRRDGDLSTTTSGLRTAQSTTNQPTNRRQNFLQNLRKHAGEKEGDDGPTVARESKADLEKAVLTSNGKDSATTAAEKSGDDNRSDSSILAKVQAQGTSSACPSNDKGGRGVFMSKLGKAT